MATAPMTKATKGAMTGSFEMEPSIDWLTLVAGTRRLDWSTVRSALHKAVLALRHVAKRIKKKQADEDQQQDDSEAK
jgi:hypothetical protein